MRYFVVTGAACLLLLLSCQPEEGCTYEAAANFNLDAVVDDGTCEFPGCTDPFAQNYNSGANVDDGSCLYHIEGCTDPFASNYNPEASVDDGSCEYPILGCTDPMASNYNSEATLDDGSCEYLFEGCTDPEALNFNSAATVNDNSCTYEPLLWDSYEYALVPIGDQVWFAENLRTMVYANGDPIPSSLTDDQWISTNEGASAVYGEGDSDCQDYFYIGACDEAQSLAWYGRLYNWYAVDDVRGLCPTGWHVPTDTEWTELEDYITSQGFAGMEGDVLKSVSGWSPGGTNVFGFSAFPAGYRTDYAGNFIDNGWRCTWWSSSSNGVNTSWYRHLYKNTSSITRLDAYLRNGLSVRCLRDS